MATRKKAEELRISQVGDFKKRIGGIIELPSGLVVRYRNPGGLQAFMANGTIPNSLMPLVKKALKEGKAPETEELFGKNNELDPKLLTEMMEMFDSIAVRCIVEPRIHPTPATEDERADDKLYADELPLDDKQFLMQLITGGTKDLETFRKQLDKNVADVAEKQSPVRAAQRAAGIDPR